MQLLVRFSSAPDSKWTLYFVELMAVLELIVLD
jgi:hypothetical protein